MKNAQSLKRILCLATAVGGLLAGPALADTDNDWRGTYVGGFAGGNWADFGDNAALPTSGNNSSFLFGGDVGHNWQSGRMVFGAEWDFSKIDNHVGAGGVKFSEDWMSSARGRLGYSFNKLLPYVTGGMAVTDTVSKVSGIGSGESLQPGYTVGGGMDAMLAGNWFGRVEYLHTDVPRDTATIGGTNVSGGSGNDTARVGINYRF